MIYLQGQPLAVTMFPDNTSQVWKLPETTFKNNYVWVKWVYSHEGEFFHLAQLKALLDSRQVQAGLEIVYLPYARQDKNVSNDATFALAVFAKHLNALKFTKVTIRDPHSQEAMTRIHNSQAVYMQKELVETMIACNTELVCYPDHGALTKYSKIYSYPHIYGEKVRDQATGNILSYKVVGDCAGLNVLIVDDICDGGMTFKILAKDLLANGAKSVVLFVTHGIFSKGVRTLLDSGIARVFTADGEVTARHNITNV